MKWDKWDALVCKRAINSLLFMVPNSVKMNDSCISNELGMKAQSQEGLTLTIRKGIPVFESQKLAFAVDCTRQELI